MTKKTRQGKRAGVELEKAALARVAGGGIMAKVGAKALTKVGLEGAAQFVPGLDVAVDVYQGASLARSAYKEVKKKK
jgi:hypothetical protein